MVYGAGDIWHRFYLYIKRMDDKRPAIVLEKTIADWQGCYGYVENVARAIALAVDNDRATGRIYNVCESPMSEADWIKAIAKVIGWHGNVVIVSKSQMPDTWEFHGNLDQHWITDSSRIRTELNYTEIIERDKALKRTIAWERANLTKDLPQKGYAKLLDYRDEDAILANL